MVTRYWPLEAGRTITSPFGWRGSEWHAGVDFGFPGGSAGRRVFACQAGTVQFAGKADGYGGDPSGLAGWLVIDSDDDEGGGCLEYGHIVRLPRIKVGDRVTSGQHIGFINPNRDTNGGTEPHLHLSDMPAAYSPDDKQDPLPRLRGAREPGGAGAAVLASATGKDQIVPNPTPANPDYNEYAIWSPNGESRGGTKVDMFILHTEEGGPTKDGADRLARWISDPARQVSYHYCVSEDPDDHGVTVVDTRDTATMSWSCLSGNARSINLVFAGSKASWTREEWLRWAPRAIDVAAYLAAADCAQYSIPRRVIKPPYGPAGGVSDHRWVTRYMKDGTHTDVGGPMGPPWTGFPWDVFETAFLRYAQPPAPKPVPQYPQDYTDRQLLEAIYRRLDGLALMLGDKK